jgi:2-oxoglutarate dehydrogenase E1 component
MMGMVPSGSYAEEMYRLWRQNPSTVHPSWAAHFQQVDTDAGVPTREPSVVSGGDGESSDYIRLTHLIRAFQVRGHELADQDPLQLAPKREVPELDYRNYGFTEQDLNRPIRIPTPVGTSMPAGFLASLQHGNYTLQQVIDKLRETYCGRLAIEYMHIRSREKCNWIREQLEKPEKVLSHQETKQLLERLTFAVMFEEFLAQKFTSVTASEAGIAQI